MARRRFLAQVAAWPLAALIFVSLIEWADRVITE